MDKAKERDRMAKYRYTTEIQQMMFVFGEVQDPLTETTMLIEDIVRSQVIEIIVMAAAQAQRRGSRFMAAEDFIFLIRHDRTK
ncbi:Transcription initiation protein spt3, partial [Coemansia sp. RSA 2052]